MLKMPVTQQRLLLPEKLRALQKAIVNNGLREKFAELINAIGIQLTKDENLLNEDALKFAPKIDKMQRVMKEKLAGQLEQNEQRLQQRFQVFIDTETDLRRRLKQLEAQNNELSSITARDKVKLGEQALKASLFDKTQDEYQLKLNQLQLKVNQQDAKLLQITSELARERELRKDLEQQVGALKYLEGI